MRRLEQPVYRFNPWIDTVNAGHAPLSRRKRICVVHLPVITERYLPRFVILNYTLGCKKIKAICNFFFSFLTKKVKNQSKCYEKGGICKKKAAVVKKHNSGERGKRF